MKKLLAVLILALLVVGVASVYADTVTNVQAISAINGKLPASFLGIGGNKTIPTNGVLSVTYTNIIVGDITNVAVKSVTFTSQGVVLP